MIVHLFRTWGEDMFNSQLLVNSYTDFIPTLKRLRSVALGLKTVYIQVLACIENNYGSDG